MLLCCLKFSYSYFNLHFLYCISTLLLHISLHTYNLVGYVYICWPFCVDYFEKGVDIYLEALLMF